MLNCSFTVSHTWRTCCWVLSSRMAALRWALMAVTAHKGSTINAVNPKNIFCFSVIGPISRLLPGGFPRF